MSIKASSLARRSFPVVLVAASALNPAAAGAVPVGTTGGTVVPMRSALRACDFSPIPNGPSASRATASAVIRTRSPLPSIHELWETLWVVVAVGHTTVVKLLV